MNDRETERPERAASERILCPHCFLENFPEAHACERCGAPIGFLATTGPLEQIHAQFYACRRAMDGGPRGIVLVGMWLIWGPTFFFCGLYGAGIVAEFLEAFRRGPGAVEWLLLSIPFVVLGLVYFVTAFILHRVTRNYIRKRDALDLAAAGGEPPEDEDDGEWREESGAGSGPPRADS